MNTLARTVAVTAACLLLPALAFAQAPAAPAPGAPPPADEEPGLDVHAIPGPVQESLGHDIRLNLPAGYVYFNAADAKKLAQKMGNVPDDSLLGMIFPQEVDEERGPAFFVEITYDEAGYIKDDEKIDADAILDSIREGTEEANKIRQQNGVPPIHVDGWAEPPRYDKGKHHLVWAVKGSSTEGSVINLNTRILGRRGYMSLNLIASPEELAGAKPHVATLLGATQFADGARYQDFQPKSDKVAEFGLAALIAGGAGAAALKVAKVGLLAKLGAILLKGLKPLLLILVAGGAWLRRLFGRKKDEPTATTAVSAPPPPPPADPPAAPPSPPSEGA